MTGLDASVWSADVLVDGSDESVGEGDGGVAGLGILCIRGAPLMTSVEIEGTDGVLAGDCPSACGGCVCTEADDAAANKRDPIPAKGAGLIEAPALIAWNDPAVGVIATELADMDAARAGRDDGKGKLKAAGNEKLKVGHDGTGSIGIDTAGRVMVTVVNIGITMPEESVKEKNGLVGVGTSGKGVIVAVDRLVDDTTEDVLLPWTGFGNKTLSVAI